MARLIGLDVGTSSCKAIAIDESGRILDSAQRTYPLLSPSAGWNEQRPEDWWVAARQCLDELSHVRADAVGLTGQMHGSVFIDVDGRPIRSAILWNDMRTTAEAEEIEDLVGPEQYRKTTCNRSDPGLQAPKLLWLRRHEPEHWEQVRKVVSPKDYIAYKLTGQLATDYGDASGTGLFDTARLKFSEEILSALEIDPCLMPTPVPSNAIVGRDMYGRPVVIGSGDQAANGVGVGAIGPGIMSIALGSSGVLFTACDTCEYHESGTLNCFAHATGKWLSMGVTLNCGTLIEWARRELFAGAEAAQISHAADRSRKEITFVPYVGGERCPISLSQPIYEFSDEEAEPEDKAAAIIRAITFNLRSMLPMVASIAGMPSAVRLTGGGASSRFWRQAIADTFEVPVERLATDEGPSFGAALLAGTAIGVWPTLADAVANTVRTEVTERPQRQMLASYELWRTRVQDFTGKQVSPFR